MDMIYAHLLSWQKMVAMSDRVKVGIVIGVLVLLVPAWNFVANGAGGAFHPKPKPVLNASASNKPPGEAVKYPPSLGPKKAPVTITMFVNGHNSCHQESVDILEKLVKEYPKEVRVAFEDTSSKKGSKLAEAHKISCEAGLVVNGRTAFRLPGKLGVVILDGPLDKGHYTLAQLREVIEQQIKEKTGKPAVRVQLPSNTAKAGPASASAGGQQTAETTAPTTAHTPLPSTE